MTQVRIDLQQTKYKKLTVIGHSGFAAEGSDIVSAAVSSSLNLVASIFDKSGTKYKESVGKTSVIIELSDLDDPIGQYVFDALFTELSALSENFPQNVKVTVADVFR